MAAMPIRRVDAPRRRVGPSTATQRARAATPPAGRRPELRLVPQPRAAANAVIILVTIIAGLMLAAVVLHTRLSDRQLEIDRLEAEVTSSLERFDLLRQQRAELRSPNRLAQASADFGMRPSPDTEFVEVDSATLAQVLSAAGTVDERPGAVDRSDPLQQIQRVREAEG